VGDQVKQRALDEIAEAAALWVSATKIAVKDPKREFLKDFVGVVVAAHHLAQVALDRPFVSSKQFFPGRLGGFARSVVRLVDKRPPRWNKAQPHIRSPGVVHEPGLRAASVIRGVGSDGSRHDLMLYCPAIQQ